MNYMSFFFALSFMVIMAACYRATTPDAPSKYPISMKGDTVDQYFGESVPDPYRWMENDTSDEVADWVTEENKVTFGFLDKIPYREEVKNRLEVLNNYEKLGSPFKRGDYIYYFRNEGLQNHSVLYRRKGEQGAPEVF